MGERETEKDKERETKRKRRRQSETGKRETARSRAIEQWKNKPIKRYRHLQNAWCIYWKIKQSEREIRGRPPQQIVIATRRMPRAAFIARLFLPGRRIFRCSNLAVRLLPLPLPRVVDSHKQICQSKDSHAISSSQQTADARASCRRHRSIALQEVRGLSHRAVPSLTRELLDCHAVSLHRRLEGVGIDIVVGGLIGRLVVELVVIVATLPLSSVVCTAPGFFQKQREASQTIALVNLSATGPIGKRSSARVKAALHSVEGMACSSSQQKGAGKKKAPANSPAQKGIRSLISRTSRSSSPSSV